MPAKKSDETKAIELATLDEYAIMEVQKQELLEIVQANVGAAGFSVADLERIKMPAGGGQFWEVPTLEGEIDAEKAVEGIIIEWQDRRAYWSVPLDESGGGSPPDCSSDDAIHGIGDPGGSCETCPLSKFGSGPGGVGQACKQMRMLYMMRPDQILPVVIAAPPTSLLPVRQYMLRLTARRVPFYAVVTRLELEKASNGNGIGYSKIKAVMSARLDPDTAGKIKDIRETLRPFLTQIRTQDLIQTASDISAGEGELEEISD